MLCFSFPCALYHFDFYCLSFSQGFFHSQTVTVAVAVGVGVAAALALTAKRVAAALAVAKVDSGFSRFVFHSTRHRQHNNTIKHVLRTNRLRMLNTIAQA